MSLISNVYVQPVGPLDSNILFVGEAPGGEEEIKREPFVGVSGQLLMDIVSRYGLSRNEVRLANLCNYRPSSNKFANLVGSPELKEGLEELYDYIRQYKPNVICALGGQALHYLTGRFGIDAWRGSIITTSIQGVPPVKVIPAYHPARVLRDRSLYPIFDADVGRAIHDRHFPDLRYPEQNVKVVSNGIEAEEACNFLLSCRRLASDIESVMNTTKILCIGFAYSPTDAIVFPWEFQYESAIRRILESNIPKSFHFGTYDTTVLEMNGFPVNNYNWDTLVAQHTLNPELPRSLAFLTSIYTRRPYYKDTGRGSIPTDSKAWSRKHDKGGLYEYNGVDCISTYEIQDAQEKDFQENKDLIPIFEQTMSLIPMAREMGLNGMLIDHSRRLELQKILLAKWARKQFALDALLGRECNVRSPKLKDILYNQLGLPVRKKRDGTITTDEDAIVSLISFVKGHIEGLKTQKAKEDWEVKMAVLKGILEIRGVRQMLSNYILAKCSDDMRMRAIYKVAGPETGRWAAEGFVDNTGVNPQTFPRGHIEADERDEKFIALAEKAGLMEVLSDDDRVGEDTDATGDDVAA